MTRVEVDQSLCQSARYCLRTAPAIFALDADGIAAVKDTDGRLGAGPVDIPAEQARHVDTAAWDCPAAAIILTEQGE